MMNEELFKKMMEVYTNPLFKTGFFEFFQKMQLEGIEAAKRFWGLSPEKRDLFPNAAEVFEKMVDFYITLGFVPRIKYDGVLKEDERLKFENAFLKDTLQQLQKTVFSAGNKEVQEAWQAVIDRQLEMNKEIAKNFFELFRGLRSGVRQQ